MQSIRELDDKIRELENSLNAAKMLRQEKAAQADNLLLSSLANISHRMASAMKYGGDAFEYLDEQGIVDFDLYVEGPAIHFLPELFSCFKRTAANIYAPVDKPIHIKNLTVKPLSQAVQNGQQRVLVTFFRWNYTTYKKLSLLNYRTIPFGNMVDYSLYKNVVMCACRDYLNTLGVKCLFTKFPQANRIDNPSPLERHLRDNSIYGYSKSSIEYGLNPDEIIPMPIFPIAGNNGVYNIKDTVYKFVDMQSEKINVVNGFRLTTDMPSNPEKRVWIFGSSVVLGVFADDEHTITSSLQRQLNVYFEGNNWSVVNAANYTGNNIGLIVPFLKSLPIEPGDICIFHMEFPMQLLERYDEIIDMSPYFDRPHTYGEIFVDINHMTGKGYCAQGKVLFELLKGKDYFSEHGDRQRIVTAGSDSLSRSESKELSEFAASLRRYKIPIGSIVMNCNPFTLGHRYLIEYAAAQVDQLYIFVVEEDKSIFPFSDRIELVRKGTKDLQNVTVLPSGKFIISQRTFAAYSNKAELQDQEIDASMDVEIFGQTIAPALGITVRFAGEEPLDNVTRQYNDTMKRILPRYGVEFKVIPRKESGGRVISASRVRKLLEEKDFAEISKLVPDTTLDYLRNL